MIVLNSDPEKSGGIEVTVSDVWEDLYPPAKIIENFILALIQGAERNRKKIIELEFASRFVKVLQQSLQSKVFNTGLENDYQDMQQCSKEITYSVIN